MGQDDRKLCLLYSTSQEAYIIWFWFLIHMCKMMTLQDAFFIVLKFWFSWLLEGYEGKKWPKMTKNSVCLTPYLRNCTSYNCGFWYTCVKWWYLQHFFFIFSKFWFFGVFRGEGKGQKMTHNCQFQSTTLYISKTVDHITKIVATQV